MSTSDTPRKSRLNQAFRHRLQRRRSQGLEAGRDETKGERTPNASIDCGCGRLIFGHTFAKTADLVSALEGEAHGGRDIAFYIRDPHVVLAYAPTELFLDPSHTFRLDLGTYRAGYKRPRGFFIRRLTSELDIEGINRIFQARHMVPVPPAFLRSAREGRALTIFVAEDEDTGVVLGTAMGIDHRRAFDDPELGCSLWCLAVDPQAPRPGVGQALVRYLAEHYQARGCRHLDLSVMHDNREAIRLYEKMGFVRIPVFAVKRKNPINEKLFTGPAPEAALNPYARILVDEARRRGIQVEVTDAEGGFFRLTQGGRSIHCRESLSELTTGVAVSICDDKAVTRRVVERAGVVVPEQARADDATAVADLLDRAGAVVVKPARGEQGRGVAVGLTMLAEIEAAVAVAKQQSDRVLVEAMVEGQDLRLIVIDFKLVAAAIRRPAHIKGDGTSTVRRLIEQQTRRRLAATGGESSIPLDGETARTLALAGVDYDTVLAAGRELNVRKTANLHTGGTIHDVTDIVHPRLVGAARAAARAIDIPVTGIDLMVTAPDKPDYVFIEANERPGLANHEPQPTAERFIDLLFPQSMPAAARQAWVGVGV
jgi:GNAT-family acetyltransferase (TIGR03103 family)